MTDSPLRGEEGSALVTALVLATVSLTLAGIVLTYALARETLITRDAERVEAIYAAESGVHVALSALRGGTLDTGRDSTFVLGEWEARVSTRARGGRVQIVSAVTGRWSEARATLDVMREPPKEMDAAFVFGDTLSPVTLAGRTTIRGPVRLGPRGLTTRALQGRPYRGEVNGEIAVVEGDPFPPVEWEGFTRTLARLDQWLEAIPKDLPAGLSLAPESDPAVVDERVYWPDAQVVYASDGTTLRAEDVESIRGGIQGSIANESSVQGPIVVLGSGSLRIVGPLDLPSGSTVAARDVLRVDGAVRGDGLLISGECVDLSGPVEMTAEVLASRSVRLDKGARLRFPSMVYVALERGDEDDGVQIARATVEGMVLVPETERGDRAAVRLTTSEDSRVIGAVLSEAPAEVEGTVEGTLLARRFRFFASPAVFVNWIRDAEVDWTRRPETYVVPVGVGEGPEPFVVVQRHVQSSFLTEARGVTDTRNPPDE